MISAGLIRSLVIAIRITGSEALSLLVTWGSSTSSGSSSRTRATASRTSFAASSMSRWVSNSITVRPRPRPLWDEIVLTPAIPATAPSMISVMSVSTISGAAPV